MIKHEWKSPDQTYRFKIGILKGKPLDTAGVSWRIVRRGGEDIAMFANGAMAKFYIQTEPTPKPEPPGSFIPMDKLKGGDRTEAERLMIDAAMFEQSAILQDVQAHAELPAPVIMDSAQGRHWSIGVYRGHFGIRPTHPCAPVYAILQNHSPVSTVTRSEVGTGLREFLWIYQKLREYGRNRLTAFAEAYGIYRL